MSMEWSTKLSPVILDERKQEKRKNLPLPQDVQKLLGRAQGLSVIQILCTRLQRDRKWKSP
ncbi:hypothetical protein FSP39_014032 [Pinctada imbricata]|uniref:Uncharacterized protein n=1 Tax=Pinctada imbricata TaxID=66713 RepID=A0AA88YLM9_PINIB|nr:hypothetical protein FSP39_014032 [Pinctada imbricata]